MLYKKLDKKYISMFWKLVIASLIYVLPIVLANRYYNDDLTRALKGLTGWKGDGRPLGEYLILFLCGGHPIVDISPLLLILSIVFLSFSLVSYASEYFKGFVNENTEVLVLLFVITNPFAVSNLSYKFDCIIMFASLSLTFLAYAVPVKVSYVRLILCSGIAGILIMSFYQPAIGMCIILFIIAVFFNLMENKRQLKFEFIRLISIVIGATVYKVVVAPHYVDAEGWRHEAARMIPDLSIDSVQIVLKNIENYSAYIGGYVRNISFFNKLVLVIILIASLISVIIRYLSASPHKGCCRIFDVIFIIISPLMAFVGSFAPLVVLTSTSLTLKSRVLISFGGFFLLIGIFCLYCQKKCRVVAGLLLLIALLSQYISIYAYGNALKSQNEYEKYLVYNIAHDLETLNVSEGIEKISFYGNSPRCMQLQMMCKKYPFFQEIVPVYFNNDTWIGGAWVYHYLQQDMEIEALTDEDIACVDSAESIIENARYSCYINKEKAIIQFH